MAIIVAEAQSLSQISIDYTIIFNKIVYENNQIA